MLSTTCTEKPPNMVMSEIIDFYKSLTPAQQLLLSEVCKLFKLLLVMPATNATSERSFSPLCRIKSYLHSTMNQERLNHLMILHIHREHTNKFKLLMNLLLLMSTGKTFLDLVLSQVILSTLFNIHPTNDHTLIH